MRRHLANGAIRVRRDVRFALVDRYRALLDGSHEATTTLAAAVVDGAYGLRGAATRRRTPPVDGPRLIRAALGEGDVLSLIVTGAASGQVVLRRGERTVELATVVDEGETITRCVAKVPAAAADGADWSVEVGGSELAVVDPAALPRGFATANGHLVLRGSSDPAGVTHTVEVGVRTAIVRWHGAPDDELVLLDGPTVAHVVAAADEGERTAVLDLAVLDEILPDGAPLGLAVQSKTGREPLTLTSGRFATDARPAVPPPLRVVTPGGRRVELGYAATGDLEIGEAAPTATAWA